MKVKNLLKGLEFACDNEIVEREIQDISFDSNSVKEGDLFVALKGSKVDGNDFVKLALSKGAACVVSDSLTGENIIKVDDARVAFSLASKNFFGKACDSLCMIGVTGTNGKTTTTHIISQILEAGDCKVGIIGTEGIKYNGRVIESGMTTPDPYFLHKVLKDMKDEGIKYVVMEASAHAIALKKLEGIKFAIGVLTNITEDHLDYFKTMESYSKAKLDFFDKDNMKLGIVCSDDPYARTLIDNTKVPILSYGLDNPSDIFAVNLKKKFDKSCFTCNCMDEIFDVSTNLVGKYNVENTLAAIAVARVLDVPVGLIQLGLLYVRPVEGRFNVLSLKGKNIVIDYAHTPDGLANVIQTARAMTEKRLITLFGCGGNRDRLKRKIMGKIASENSDKVYVTSDNPRFEEPNDIINEILDGVSGDYVVCENRAKAIEMALDDCGEGDTLIIAGKGSEKYQDIKGEKIPYNDMEEVHKYLKNKLTQIKGGKEDD